ncbi:hypothetical protein BD289DRAFT_487100 [Coniella lustricola]|uniref:Uncharacterized protein n=1 Tax=Coniella lustricola TaxID=2025994 RepID=A0A2T2ZSV8_9PEZI|nr:hypothetical protein BD289DRAFT_487100 [Coniella lustricola]
MAPFILRLPLRSPSASQKRHVLVAVSPSTDDAATHPLDLELVATENAKAYVATLQHAKVGKYKHDTNACSDDRWQACLKELLLLQKQHQHQHDSLAGGGIDAYAETSNEGYLFIHVQQKRAGAAETLGSLKLRKSNKAAEDIDMFDWCTESVSAREQLQQEVAQLQCKHDALQKLVSEETARFRELERSKQEFETHHDSWLKDLLNEKKLKIRMQEQILAAASVHPAKGTNHKRKHGAHLDADLEESGQDVKPDEMDVDVDVDMDAEAAESHDEMSDAGQTTQDSESASASEAEATPNLKHKNTAARQPAAPSSPGSPARGSKKAPARRQTRYTRNKEALTTGSAASQSAGSESNSEHDAKPTKPTKKPAPTPTNNKPVFDSDESTASE